MMLSDLFIETGFVLPFRISTAAVDCRFEIPLRPLG